MVRLGRVRGLDGGFGPCRTQWHRSQVSKFNNLKVMTVFFKGLELGYLSLHNPKNDPDGKLQIDWVKGFKMLYRGNLTLGTQW